jgi:hypothetical protein
MHGSKAYSFLVIAIIFSTLLMSACGGKAPQKRPSPLNITTLNLPVGAIGDAYKVGLVATGGQQPYTWTIDSGALPPGLSLTTDGVISGTPTTPVGTFGFILRVTDSQSPVKVYQVGSTSITINPPLSFYPPGLSPALIGVPYSSAVVASGGITPYTYTLISEQDGGCLFTTTPNCSSNGGLTLNADGTITGTPTGPTGIFPFTVRVTDSFLKTATGLSTITVYPRLLGNYAFSFNGYNQQGQAFYMAGSFVADGNGNITSGVFDRNGNDSIGAKTDVMMTPGTGGSGGPGQSGGHGLCSIPSAATGSVYFVWGGGARGSQAGPIWVPS